MVKQEEVQETFIRNIFTKKRCLNEVGMIYKMQKILQVNLSSFTLVIWMAGLRLVHEWLMYLSMTPNLQYFLQKILVHCFVEYKNNQTLTVK